MLYLWICCIVHIRKIVWYKYCKVLMCLFLAAEMFVVNIFVCKTSRFVSRYTKTNLYDYVIADTVSKISINQNAIARDTLSQKVVLPLFIVVHTQFCTMCIQYWLHDICSFSWCQKNVNHRKKIQCIPNTAIQEVVDLNKCRFINNFHMQNVCCS